MLKTLSNKNNSLTCGWFLNFQMPIILLIRNVIFDRIFHVLETNICIDFDVQKCNSYLCDRLWPKTHFKKKSKIKMQLEWSTNFSLFFIQPSQYLWCVFNWLCIWIICFRLLLTFLTKLNLIFFLTQHKTLVVFNLLSKSINRCGQFNTIFGKAWYF